MHSELQKLKLARTSKPSSRVSQLYGHYVLEIKRNFHLLHPDPKPQNNTSSSNLIFDIKMFQRQEQKSFCPSLESHNSLGSELPGIFQCFIILKMVRLQTFLSGIFHTDHFCFFTRLVFKLACQMASCRIPGVVPLSLIL